MSVIARDKKLITVKAAANVLGVHPITLRRWISSGRVPALQLGGPGNAVRLDPDELERFIYSFPRVDDAA
jgi:excisionase family DNA binding protein